MVKEKEKQNGVTENKKAEEKFSDVKKCKRCGADMKKTDSVCPACLAPAGWMA